MKLLSSISSGCRASCKDVISGLGPWGFGGPRAQSGALGLPPGQGVTTQHEASLASLPCFRCTPENAWLSQDPYMSWKVAFIAGCPLRLLRSVGRDPPRSACSLSVVERIAKVFGSANKDTKKYRALNL